MKKRITSLTAVLMLAYAASAFAQALCPRAHWGQSIGITGQAWSNLVVRQIVLETPGGSNTVTTSDGKIDATKLSGSPSLGDVVMADTLAMSNSANAGSCLITLQSDKGDDAGDKVGLNVADGGGLAIQSDADSKGTLAPKLTVGPTGIVTMKGGATLDNTTSATTLTITEDTVAIVGDATVSSDLAVSGDMTVASNASVGTFASSGSATVGGTATFSGAQVRGIDYTDTNTSWSVLTTGANRGRLSTYKDVLSGYGNASGGGIVVYSNTTANFTVTHGGNMTVNGATVIFSGLPTSTNGLTPGCLWLNSNVLTIIP